MKSCVLLFLGFILFVESATVQGAQPSWIEDGPNLASGSASFEIPMEVIATKLYIEVEIGGKPRRFVVDTGSPSMIDTQLAKTLGVDVVGTSNGMDAHGAFINSDVVQANLSLGGVTLYKVPMVTADFSASEVTKTFIGDGVLGSEILPLGAWQFDLKNSVIRFNTDLKKLPHLGGAVKSRLYNFGYPHMPIFDVKFAKHARSKAMFDTGAPTYFTISSADLAGARRAAGIGRTISGFGSPGASLGGQAPDGKQLQAELNSLTIGKLKLGRVAAVRREFSPSLIGANILEHFVVTLDASSERVYFLEYSNGQFARPSFGFTLAFNEKISIAVVWEESPAQKAGLLPGMHLTSINGRETEVTREGIRRAITAMSSSEISVTWDSGSAKLTRKSHILKK